MVAATAVFLSFNLISKAFLSLLLDINQKHCFLGVFFVCFFNGCSNICRLLEFSALSC